MPRAAPAITAMNMGEFSPLVHGRVDLERYNAALALCRNFVPLAQGGLRNRPGTRYVGGAKSHATNDSVRLIPFQFSVDQTFVLELGNLYMRVWKNRAPVLSGGVPVEFVTPWPTSALAELSYVQSADVIYVAHRSYPPQQIARVSDTSWTVTAMTLNDGPFEDDDPGSITLSFGAQTGNTTCTASGAVFTAQMVGSLIRAWSVNVDVANVMPWEPGKAYSVNDIVYQNGRIYQALNTATSGTIPPTHEEAARWDGKFNTSVRWNFLSGFYGVARITGFTSATSVSVTILQRMPWPIAGGGAVSTRWALGAWSAVNGYPAAVTFFQDRLCFGGTVAEPDTVWMSGAGDYANFQNFALNGQVTAELGITITVSSQQVNRIRWMTPEGAGLLVGTEANEFLISPATQSEGVSPSNVRAMAQTSYGSAPVMPVRYGGATLFVQRARRQVREAVYDYSSDRYVAPDLALLSEHLVKPGVAAMALALEPHSVVWVALTDGSLRGLTYDRDQEVTAWHQHRLGGNGDAGGAQPFVESLTVVPSPDGSRSDLWLAVRRWVGGQARRFIEVLDFDRDMDGDIRDAFFLDAGVTWTGGPSVTVTGLSHLNGETVQVVADGGAHADRTVSGGQITLDRAASKVHVGFFRQAEAETLRIEAGAADGTAQGKIKRFSRIRFRLNNSVGGKAGQRSAADLDTLVQRRGPMTQPPELYTGDVELSWPWGPDRDGQIYIRQDQPLPLNVLAIFPVVDTQQ